MNEGFPRDGYVDSARDACRHSAWQVAIATAFAVVIGKEAFGGTGMNVLNVALTPGHSLYFAYPSQISGEVWTVLGKDRRRLPTFWCNTLAIAAQSTGNVVTDLNTFGAGWADGIYDFLEYVELCDARLHRKKPLR